jgi:hypothetical protein
VVGVDQQQGQWCLLAGYAPPFLVEQAVELAAIGDIEQAVARGQRL